jgi:EAL domain-containing protein (putative c-di-GMP-specific phosphodiesterase class I)
VLAVIALGHSLGKQVVAEAIETQQQLDFLRANHCDLGQGFYLGYPRPLEVVDANEAKGEMLFPAYETGAE